MTMRVLKIGGNELSDPAFLALLGQNVAALRAETVDPLLIVHGGGRDIAAMQAQLGLETIKVDGLRVTDADSLAAAQMVLSGHTNKVIVKALLAAGVDALGVSGVDAGLLRCRKKAHPAADLGFVGEIVSARAALLQQLAALGLVVVLSPISLGLDGQTYNVNADEAAAAAALALRAEELVFISNVPGVLRGEQLLPRLTAGETEDLIAAEVINGGMIPKVRAALDAVAQGVARARITNVAGLRGGGTTFVGGAAA
jgi:acetylglutamate kinase